MTRFFDQPVSNVKLYFRVEKSLGINGDQNTKEWFQAVVQECLEQIQLRARVGFVPSDCDYEMYSKDAPPGSPFETGKTRISRHPLGFYEIWVDNDGRLALKTAKLWQEPYKLLTNKKVSLSQSEVTLKAKSNNAVLATFPK